VVLSIHRQSRAMCRRTRDGMGKREEELATNDPRRVIGVPVARVGIDFIPWRRILRQRVS